MCVVKSTRFRLLLVEVPQAEGQDRCAPLARRLDSMPSATKTPPGYWRTCASLPVGHVP